MYEATAAMTAPILYALPNRRKTIAGIHAPLEPYQQKFLLYIFNLVLILFKHYNTASFTIQDCIPITNPALSPASPLSLSSRP